jgi:predicted TIM-barrel fold metal-dependent hydrolase
MKRLEGRDEPILAPDTLIIDAHHHLFDRPALRYMLDDYLNDVRAGHRVVASVYVETQAFIRIEGPEVLRSIGEIEFANGVGAMCASGVYGNVRACAAIVGYADLRLGDEIARLLDRALEAAPERYRGVRQIAMEHSTEAPFRFFTHRPPVELLSHPGFRKAFRHLAPRGLIFDAAVFNHQLPDIVALADAFPETTMTLNHAGVALGLDMDAKSRMELFHRWRNDLFDLAQRPNVYCKVGGLGMPFWGFGLENRSDPVGYRELSNLWRPYVETAIQAFGAHRCMLESNFPPDGRSCGYVPLWNALKDIVSGCSAAERADLFHATAARIHRIDLSWLGDGSQPG